MNCIEKHGTPEEFTIAILNAIPEISIDEAILAIRNYYKDYKSNQVQAGVKPACENCKYYVRDMLEGGDIDWCNHLEFTQLWDINKIGCTEFVSKSV